MINENFGTIDVYGSNNTIRIVSDRVMGIVRCRGGTNNTLNSTPLPAQSARVNPLPPPPLIPIASPPSRPNMPSPVATFPRGSIEEAISRHHQLNYQDSLDQLRQTGPQVQVNRVQAPLPTPAPERIQPNPRIESRITLGGLFSGLMRDFEEFVNRERPLAGIQAILEPSAPTGDIEVVIISASPNPIPDTCPICHDSLNRGHQGSCYLDCMDWFHEECVMHWLNTGKRTCPKCRNETTTVCKVGN